MKSHQIIIIPLLLSLTLISCEDLEHANPADPAFELQPPTLLTVDAVTDTSMVITWKDNEVHSKEFVIQRKSGSASYATIGTVTKNILTFRDMTCVLGAEYSYSVRSKVESNLSVSSNIIKKATEFPAPSDLSAVSVSDSEIQLSWTDNTGYETGFRVERDAGSRFVKLGTVSSDITEYTDTGLTYGQSYTYRVVAYTAANTSSWVTIAAATEFPAPSDLSAVSVSDSEMQLSWTDNTGYERGFRVERDAGSGFVEIGTVGENVTEYTDTGLTFGRSYKYRVAAYTVANTSSWVTIAAATEFPAPSDLSATSISDSEIQLSWIDNTGYETGFRAERDAGSGFVEIGTVGENVTEYTVTGLTYGQSYDFRVAAYTAVNTSSWATVTGATEFPAPSDLSATSISDSEIQLSWTDITGYETGFKIEREVWSGFVEISTVGENVTEYTDTGLTLGQSYTYRVAAYTASNTSDYSTAATETACMNCVVDYDGNLYETITIGNQTWMAENLKVTHYRDGTAIPNLTSDGDWTSTSAGAYCYYDNNSGNSDTYGALYNLYAVTDSRNIAPEGWHVPTDAEWQTLEDYLGGSSVAGGKLKEAGTSHWNSPNTGATNESGFTALPGGYRLYDLGNYYHMGDDGYYWSATEYDSYGAWNRGLHYNYSDVNRSSSPKSYGFAVRLVRD